LESKAPQASVKKNTDVDQGGSEPEVLIPKFARGRRKALQGSDSDIALMQAVAEQFAEQHLKE